ncbi:hypothetical protein NQ318_022797 [Aromia moschata]|uniref:C3H1-type domain-containing protein n=1 Tax=Aromia moschata TaxID=1265417 RepID=A0AAV8YFK5_9CUCU|nr:hypothetical protein NQ318_022797 [Aromia moschata]
MQNRLKEALENEGENPDIFLFEIAGDINSALQSLKGSLEQKLIENGSNLEQKFEETSGNLRGMEQNLRGMEQRLVETSGNLRGMEQKLIENMDQKLMENYTSLEKKIMENSSYLQKQIGEYGSEEQQQMVNTSLKSPGSDSDRLSKPELSSPVEISKIRMKPPLFDGKSSWVNYLRQFEAAAKANGWSLAEKATALTLALRGDATDILQTLSLEEQEDYHQLVRHLEMRYGQSHLEHVYHSQLKNRYQKSNESLQEFEADIARLVRLAYSSTPENVMERLAVQAFLDGLRDTETRQALTLARPSKLVDALARALEFEAAKQSCRGQAKVRRVEEGVEEGTCNEAEIRRVVEGMLEKRQIRCWNCGNVTLVGKLKEVDRRGQSSTSKKQAPKKTARVASLQHPSNSVFVDGLVDGKERLLLLDTGATRTIIRPDIVGTAARITPTSWRLRTATGDPATIRGETNVTIVIGNVSFEHRALVAEIEDELILGMDIMNTKGFKLDFKNNVLKINGEEIVLHRKTEETIRVVLAEDTAVPERSEMILDAHLDGNPCVGNIMMFEPRSHDGEVARGIAVGKALLLTEKTVPPTGRRFTKQLGKHLQASSWAVNCVYPVTWKFGCTPGDDVAGEDYVSTLRQRMDDIHERVRSNIQGASDRMKETYDINANDGRYQPGNQLWEGPYEVVTRINDVVYRIQKLPRGKPRVVHFNRLAPFAGSNDEQAGSQSSTRQSTRQRALFEEFMLLHSNGQKARYGVTREEPRDLFQTPADFCLAHCVAADLRMSRGIALTFKKAFGQLEELRRQRPEVGRVLQITAAEQEKERSVFYLVTKQLSHHKPTYQTVWDTSRAEGCALVPEHKQFGDTEDSQRTRWPGLEGDQERSLNEKTVDCFFYQTSRCKNGSFCRYRHRPGDDTIRDEMSLRRGQCYERWASPPLPVLTPADQSSR